MATQLSIPPDMPSRAAVAMSRTMPSTREAIVPRLVMPARAKSGWRFAAVMATMVEPSVDSGNGEIAAGPRVRDLRKRLVSEAARRVIEGWVLPGLQGIRLAARGDFGLTQADASHDMTAEPRVPLEGESSVSEEKKPWFLAGSRFESAWSG